MSQLIVRNSQSLSVRRCRCIQIEKRLLVPHVSNGRHGVGDREGFLQCRAKLKAELDDYMLAGNPPDTWPIRVSEYIDAADGKCDDPNNSLMGRRRPVRPPAGPTRRRSDTRASRESK